MPRPKKPEFLKGRSPAIGQEPSDREKGSGKPKLTVDDWNIVKRLGSMQCTVEEVASFLGICQDTLNSRCKDRFGETIGAKLKYWADGGKASLRRKQWLLADNNASMAIFLGKNILGQQDNPKVIEELDGKLLELLDVLKKADASDVTATEPEAD